MFEVQLALRPPEDDHREPIVWTLHLGARTKWRFPFAVLFGQRCWFDRFTTTIHATSVSVDPS
jgi:hypothetical protein